MLNLIKNIRLLVFSTLMVFLASASNAQADVTFLDLSWTVPQGPNRLAIFQICYFGTIDSILYNGEKMTLIKQQSNTSINIDIWALPLGSGPEINSFPSIRGNANPSSADMISF